MQPDVFVLDEPTSNLDKESIERLKNTLLLWKKQGKTIVIAEHRLYWLKEICDRVVYLEHGRIMFDITMQEFLKFSEQKLQNLGLRTMQPHCDESSKRHEYIAKKSDIVLKNYYFSYGEKKVLEFGDMQLPKNELIAITGQNGAGKSTTMKMLLGLTAPTAGSFSIDGKTFPNDRISILKEVGSFIEAPSFYANLTGRENLDIICRILGLPQSAVDEALELVGLSDFGSRLAKKYSLGMKQRLGLAGALLGRPPILILDEPTNGLDPSGIHEIRNLIKSLPDIYDCTVLISSHMLSEIELIADDIGILNHG